ncbi:arrestin domain-containing protein 3-like [Ruditapes philippinarum]|uniref:arrestin domain-containing protein 3-like n=1 Tax=Ruditapes philippinarum TaxID=129788 RepID=UPI00295B7F80|nr:arrestin domain-containing protein 3-like [Ruditapes philippinarum]
MGKEVFQIILDNQSGVFYPGQPVTGRVDLELFDSLKVRAINLHFRGYANVHWTERSGGKNKRTRHYSSNESYMNNKVCLFGKEQHGEDSVKLEPGKYSYPFNFQLPQGIPSSYEATIGRVRYFIQSEIDIPWAFDKQTKRMFTVVNLLDLNTVPNAMSGASKTDQKTLCCLCCESDPISAMVTIDRIGYVPGEGIVFRSEINNKSDREMTCSKAQLLMTVQYHATSKTRSVNNIVNEIAHGKIEGGGTDIWMNEKLHIPAVPPSYLQGCNIIDIRYYLMMNVDPSGLGFDLNVPVEVVIGSIPLASIAQQHGMTVPSAPSQPLPPLPPGAPQGLYSDSSLPTNIPQAALAESALGRVNTKEEGDTDEITGNTNFAPVYTLLSMGQTRSEPNVRGTDERG